MASFRISSRYRLWRAGAAAPPRDGFALAAIGGVPLLILLQSVLFGAAPAGVVATSATLYVAAAAVAGDQLRRTYPHATLGLCNIVTLARMVLVAALFAPLVAGAAQPWIVVGLASLALALDGIDGWLARREGLVSGFGARFDVEVDAALALMLALLALSAGATGPLVLVLGLIRYLFVAATLALPWLACPLPDRSGRKAVCVFQLGTLIVLQVPAATPLAAGLLVPAAALALIWSFGRDTHGLWRARR